MDTKTIDLAWVVDVFLLLLIGIGPKIALVTISAESESLRRIALFASLCALVLALDVAVFRWANRVGEHRPLIRRLVSASPQPTAVLVVHPIGTMMRRRRPPKLSLESA